jgi:4-carboxymuconolactone decarboxylase
MRTFPALLISLNVMTLAAQRQPSTEQDAIRITRSGSQPPRLAPADNFIGGVRIDSSFGTNAPARMAGARVVFERGARTAWHTHPLGQLLIVTAGTGRGQRWGDPVDEIRQGGRGLDSAGAEALARGRAEHFDDAHRYRGTARRQGC